MAQRPEAECLVSAPYIIHPHRSTIGASIDSSALRTNGGGSSMRAGASKVVTARYKGGRCQA
jgi:hypothetical protein